jgi:glyoxylase-like metal-dependent hydrolase (beta-lactamase superfamily II)
VDVEALGDRVLHAGAAGMAMLLLVLGSPTPLPAQSASPIPASHGTVVPLGEGVYAFVRAEPLGLAVNANSLLIVNDSDVVVVDAQFTREATVEVLAALRRITSKPVSFVVNTHWHDDHFAGNQVYRDTFPDVRFVAHADTKTDLVAMGRPNRTGTGQGAPPLADRFERLLGMGLGIDSTPVSDAERASVTSALRIMRTYLAELPGFREHLPDVVVERDTTLLRGTRRIEIRWLGRGNTRGDLVVHLPREGIVATGDLVVAPVPFAFNSYPTEWVAVLDSVMALRPAALVPGHGPVMRDIAYVQTVKRLLVAARNETQGAVARGLPLDSVRRVVTLDSLRRAVAGEEKWAKSMFRNFFLGPVVGRLHEEITKGALK